MDGTETALPLPAALRRTLRLTRAVITAERAARAFWAPLSLVLFLFAAVSMGLRDGLGTQASAVVALGAAGFLAVLAVRGIRRFRRATTEDAIDRLDAALRARPFSTLNDTLALGHESAGSRAVWEAHVARMRQAALAAVPPRPEPGLSRQDPFALRLAAVVAAVMALAFGAPSRVAEPLTPTAAVAAAAAASWEVWIEPPAYAARPTQYLAAVRDPSIDVVAGSRILVRLYGDPGALVLRQTLADAGPQGDPPPNDAATATVRTTDLVARTSGVLAIDGTGGREWQINILPDLAPSVLTDGPMARRADGRMGQDFRAQDDFGVTSGEARFALDLAAVDRRYGLAVEPDPREALVFDLPLPVAGKRTAFVETLAEDASKHPWSNLPVRMTLTVTDAIGQTGSSLAETVILPGRRFFDPKAAALIEMRRDLLWSLSNARRVEQVLRALVNRPEDQDIATKPYLILSVAIDRLAEARTGDGLTAERRDEVAEALWQVAVLIEDGGLDDALARMKRAQERLSEAMKNGASPDEIRKLVDELRSATDDYMAMLAERGEEDPAERFTEDQPTREITQDQIDQLMDEIQRLMEEGRMAEAQALLDQLNQLMENLKVTQGEGEGGAGGRAMRELGQTLREQQDLSDDAFRQGRSGSSGQPAPGDEGAMPGPGDSAGAQPGEGEGEDGAEGPDGPGSLADRQAELRRELERQLRALPDAQGQDAEAARRALERAGRAMDGAEQALRDEDMAGALDRQAEAIESLREGMRSLGEALARDQNRLPGADGQAQGEQDPYAPVDPLGRTEGARGGASQTEAGALNGKDVYRRAQDLLEELRRRSSDRTRPEDERDYIQRLIDPF